MVQPGVDSPRRGRRRRCTDRSRGAGHPAAPAQIPACGTTAQGSCLGCLASKRTFGYGCYIRSRRATSRTPCKPRDTPAWLDVRGVVVGRVFPLAGRLPSTGSAGGDPPLFAGFPGTTQPSDFPPSCIWNLHPLVLAGIAASRLRKVRLDGRDAVCGHCRGPSLGNVLSRDKSAVLERVGLARCPTSHDHRLWRNSRTWSRARYLAGAALGGCSACNACSFMAASASMQVCVVTGLSWPSHSAIAVMSTPDCSRCMAVEWRTRWGEMRCRASSG